MAGPMLRRSCLPRSVLKLTRHAPVPMNLTHILHYG